MSDEIPREMIDAFARAIEQMRLYQGHDHAESGTSFHRLEGGTARAAAQTMLEHVRSEKC